MSTWGAAYFCGALLTSLIISDGFLTRSDGKPVSDNERAFVITTFVLAWPYWLAVELWHRRQS